MDDILTQEVLKDRLRPRNFADFLRVVWWTGIFHLIILVGINQRGRKQMSSSKIGCLALVGKLYVWI